MTEENKVLFRTEGEPAFVPETENANSGGSPTAENENVNNADSSAGAEKKPDAQKQNVPFDQHPEWHNRERKWDTRFNDQETRHQEDMRKLREEFSAKPAVPTSTPIPKWFGGDQEQWDLYQADQAAQSQKLIDTAAEKATSIEKAKLKAVEEATVYMKSEVEAIQSDKTLNPTGAKIDQNALLKIVVDNDLVDSKGRWNYRAAFRLMQQEAPKPTNTDKKNLAGALGSEGKPEAKPTTFKTSADFKKNRPW